MVNNRGSSQTSHMRRILLLRNTTISTGCPTVHELTINKPIKNIQTIKYCCYKCQPMTQHATDIMHLTIFLIKTFSRLTHTRVNVALCRSPDYQTSFESIGLLVQYRFSRMRPSRISNQNDFSYFWFTCHLDTSNEVSSQLAFCFRIKRFKLDFQHGC